MKSKCSSGCIRPNQWRFTRSCAGWLASLCFIANALAQTDPPSLPAVSSGTLQLWLKADAGVITNASGQVSQWQDQSANTNHATQANATNQPLLVYPAGLGGGAAVRFDRVNGDYLHGTGPVYVPVAMTAFVVYNVFTIVEGTSSLWFVGTPGANGFCRGCQIDVQTLAFTIWGTDYGAPSWEVPSNTYRICTDRVNTNVSTVQLFDTSASGENDFTLAISASGGPTGGGLLCGRN
jgi:hypothetical protein